MNLAEEMKKITKEAQKLNNERLYTIIVDQIKTQSKNGCYNLSNVFSTNEVEQKLVEDGFTIVKFNDNYCDIHWG